MSVILASAGYDHTIRFWDALTGVCSRTIQHTDSQVNRLEITSDKRFLAAAGTLYVRLYDIRQAGSSGNATAAASATNNGNVNGHGNHNNGNNNPVMTFEGHTNNVTSLAFQIENKWMVTSLEDGTVKVWDVRSPSVQRSYKHHCPVNEVVIHPNQGELISCDQDGNIRIWDLGENQCTHHLIPEDDVPINSLSVASDGSMLVAGNNKGNCYVWKMQNQRDITSLTPITKFRSHLKYITRVLLSTDMKHLATCSADHTARIWSTQQNFNLETTLQGHQRWVWDCAFSADSAYLVTACSDHYVRLWDLSNSETVRQYNGHHKGAVCVALNDV
ncbi:protein required for amino acid permease transport from the Golgi to the cell surface [Suhomyces tanzawaensis NRRL Y-17324]|uniref:Target of rapamycin complex subunit LST8 n=1 Tax=Suhomyces tanzawaensis NRRL Y-17324 TaxID=984487 RepID=A0A1E4SRK7_9ASCO|nr:protein required for amino acid permease transport from the Golgi to the cell surface [Suhomyces tanzawaensis NRRL Y-17324]ODV82042.1 protein required for amino acid permease transport from the Golgi to the cell surface [Suhomyces tanzawaensis NRRL Y-17324]